MSWAGQSPQDVAARYGFVEQDSFHLVHAEPWALGDAGFADFAAALQGNPHFAATWSDVQAHLAAEGQTDFSAAEVAFTSAFTQVSQNFGVSLDPSVANNAYDTAKQFVLTGQTVAGAVATVSGLIGSIESGQASPLAITRAFTGTMIGLLTVVGAPTAGVGAIVVAGIFAAIDLISSVIGSPAPPPIGYTACGFILNQVPDWSVGCLGAWGVKNAPNSTLWRPFPEPNPGDAAWFQKGGQVGPGLWLSAFFGVRGNGQSQSYDGVAGPPVNGVNPAGIADIGQRPIDNAFPDYSEVVEHGAGLWAPPGMFGISTGLDTSGWAESAVEALKGFVKAFQGAWKANAAYALNGLNTQPDYRVLVHLLRLWNRTHDGGEFRLAPDTTTYIGGLVTAAQHANEGAELAYGGGLVLNLGPIKPVVAVPPTIAPLAEAAASVSPASSSGAAPVVAAGVVTTVALGGLWLLLGQPLTIAALKAAAGEAVHALAGAMRRL